MAVEAAFADAAPNGPNPSDGQQFGNVVKLENYYAPGEMKRAIARSVDDYNHRRYHEAFGNVTPAYTYAGRQQAVLTRRERIKRKALARRKRENLRRAA
jgi:hypothetical protein